MCLLDEVVSHSLLSLQWERLQVFDIHYIHVNNVANINRVMRLQDNAVPYTALSSAKASFWQ